MRLFEIIMAVSAAISIVNLIFFRSSKTGFLLSSVSATSAACSILTEGYRIFMLPAYILSLILLVQGTVKLCKFKKNNVSKSSAPSGSRLIKAAGISFMILLYIASLSLAILFPVIDLPVPSGPYRVGTTLMAFIDTSRSSAYADPASNSLAGTEYRSIPVRIWYPASDISGKQRINWISSREISSLFAECKNLPDILGQLALIKTNSYMDTAISDQKEKYPVIIFSGGSAMFNGQNVIQMEELASHGYVVCAVGHPYDDFACEYPDGTIIPYDPGHLKALSEDMRNAIENAKKQYGEDGKNPEFVRYVLHNCPVNTADVINWSKDMSFVADELTKLNNSESTSGIEQDAPDGERVPATTVQWMTGMKNIFAGRLDMEELGIFGHSFGGAAAGEACLRDNRFRAFINMDGTPFGTALDNVISQPFMILTTDKDEEKIIRSGYSSDQKNITLVYINGSEHMNFSDFNIIIPNIGKLTGLLGKIDEERHMEIMNRYILAFFNSHLKGIKEPILENGTLDYPEALFEKHPANGS